MLPYENLVFPAAPPDRPYAFINMVTTIDGKILSGERDEPVQDLGSANDHTLMRRIERAAQAVMIGAGTLRSTPKLHYPVELTRLVVSGSGQIDPNVRFFTDAPDRAYVVTDAEVPGVATLPLDFVSVFRSLREQGIERLLIEGGSELNACLLHLDLIDELFLTLAPKIKLGRDVPTYADGDPLPRTDLRQFEMVECHPIDHEVFLRYRRKR